MSALDLHHILFSPEPSYTPHTPSEIRASSHSRGVSSLSTITVTANSHSQPTEPLLHASTPYASSAFHNILSRQPAHPDSPRARWDMGLSLEGDSVTSHENRGYWERAARKRLRRWRALSGGLLLLIGAWALYTAVRYFVAYVIYPVAQRQAVALALGICSLLTLTLTLMLAFRPLLPPRAPRHEMPKPPRLRFRLQQTMQFLISLFLFVPAAVNFALVFVWRSSSTTALGLQGRCHWDLDVVWVGTGGQCSQHAPAWGAWLAAALARLVSTFTILVIYHLAHHAYEAARRPSTPYHTGDGKPEGPEQTDVNSARRTLSLHRVSSSPRNASNPSSPPPRPLSFFSGGRPAVIPDQHLLSASRPSISQGSSIPSLTDATSEEDLIGSTESSTTTPKLLRRVHSTYDMQGSGSRSSSGEGSDDSDLQGFADRFRSLVSQVSREIEEGLKVGDEDDHSPTSPATPPLHHVLDTHIPYISLDEFGRPTPPDERLAVLGGVVRRMPTIESVGSRERVSVRSHTWATSPTTPSSRPPTRATMLSISDSPGQSLSRSNSLIAAAAPRMASELGELPREASTSSHSSVQGSTGTSYYTAPPSGSTSTRSSGGEPAVLAARTRSNSSGAAEVLAPVTEQGEINELGRRLSAVFIDYHASPMDSRSHADNNSVHSRSSASVTISEIGELGHSSPSSSSPRGSSKLNS